MGTLATGVSIKRALEGPQLLVSWTNADDVGLTAVEIRRGIIGFPESVTDGVQVYQDLAPTPSEDKLFADVDVEGLVTYYYTVFSQVGGTWYANYTTQKREFPLDSRIFHEYLWKRLPQVYQGKDSETSQRFLPATWDDAEGWFNYWEDSTIQYGQLYRFLKVFALQFGDAEELFRYFREFYEVYSVRDDFLPYIASLLGANLIGGISLQRQRFLIAEAVALFKIRGTIDGVLRFAQGNFGTTPLLREFSYFMMESNRLDRTSVADDLVVLSNWDGPHNTIDYVVDGERGAQWSYRTIGLYFDDVLDSAITPEMLNIAEQFFADYLPGTGAWYGFVHWDRVWTETWGSAAFPAWTAVIDPNSSLGIFPAVGGGSLHYTRSLGGTDFAILDKSDIVWDDEFAVDFNAYGITWPTPIGPAAGFGVTIFFPGGGGSYKWECRLFNTSATEITFEVEVVDSAGTNVIYSEVFDINSEIGVRVERGPNGVMRALLKIGTQDRELLVQYRSADFVTDPDLLKLSIGRTVAASGLYELFAEPLNVWNSSTGWVRVYPT